jgi:hypothetical protein
MGRQRAHVKQERQLARSLEIVERCAKEVGPWQKVKVLPDPLPGPGLRCIVARFLWTCLCSEEICATAGDMNPRWLILCPTCGQPFRYRIEPERRVQSVLPQVTEDECRQLQVCVAGSTPGATTRDGVGFGVAPNGEMAVWVRQANGWEIVSSNPFVEYVGSEE